MTLLVYFVVSSTVLKSGLAGKAFVLGAGGCFLFASSQTSQTLISYFTRLPQGDNKAIGVDDTNENIGRLVERSNEVAHQALMRSISPYVNSNPSMSFTIGMTTVVVLVVVWKGKYVTREHLSTAVHTMTEEISTLSKSLDTLKSSCLDLFSQLTGRVEESIKIQEEVLINIIMCPIKIYSSLRCPFLCCSLLRRAIQSWT